MAHPDVSEVLLQDASTELAESVAGDLGLRSVTGYDELLASVDAVLIAATTTAHAELLQASVEAGVPTLCEKPISHDLQRSREVVALIHQRNVPVQMGFQRRFDPGFQAAADLVAAGGLGTLYTFRTVGHDPEPATEAYIAGSGGMFRDFSVHDFDAIRFVTGEEVVQVFAQTTVRKWDVYGRFDDCDTAIATCTLSGGALGLLSYTRHNPLGYDVRMEMFGSRDSVVVGWDPRAPLRSVEPNAQPLGANPYPDFHDRFAHAYAAEIDAFLDVARGRQPSRSTADDAVEALRAAIACDISSREHRPVALAEVS
jgi:myo-inositol 2-dehydrogenase/D-chiro-inositol 1-dehydrogenase